MQNTHIDPRIKKLLIICLILAPLLIIYFVYKSLTFHIVSTTPNLGSIGAISPELVLNFSQPIRDGSLQISSQPSIITNTTVDGKQVTLELKSPLKAGQTYTVTIDRVFSVSGHELQAKKLTFKPRDIAFNDLPASSQQKLLQNQAKTTQTRQAAVVTGTDVFVDRGLSIGQVQNLKQALMGYARQSKTTFEGAVIDTSSIKSGPIDDSGSFSFTFNVTMSKTTYAAKLVYSGATQVQLYLYQMGSTQVVYDSGVISN